VGETVPYEDQTISTRAIALLAGEQHARIDVHGAGQDGARLSLTWGPLTDTTSPGGVRDTDHAFAP
jgi:hypothetical protein